MQRVEQKSELQKTVIKLLDEHVSHLRIGKDGMVQFHFHDEKAALQIAEVLKENFPSVPGIRKISIQHQACHLTLPEEKCHIIHLNHKQMNALWGEDSNKTLFILNKMHNNAQFDELGKSLTAASESNPLLFQFLPRLRATHHWCVFQTILRIQPPEVCLKLIDSMSDTMLNQTLALQNNNGWCTIVTALQNQPPKVCIKLIDRMSDATLNQILALQSEDGCIFKAIMRYQSPEVCTRIIDRMSGATLNQTLGLQNKEGWSNIMLAAWYQTDSSFIALVKKSSPAALAYAACLRHLVDNESSIEVASQYQTASAFQVFLQHLSHPLLAKRVINEFFQKNLKNLFSCFKRIALYQTPENCSLFLSLIDAELVEKLLKNIRTDIESYATRSALRALQYKLEQRGDYSQDLTRLLEPLHQYDAMKSVDEKKSAPYDAPCDEREKEALSLFSAGAFVKIVRADEEKNNGKFLTHLIDPTKRQAIRTRLKKKEGFKLLFESEIKEIKEDEKKEQAPSTVYSSQDSFFRIINARTEQERELHKKQKEPYTHSTKHPVSYVSEKLHAGLFGYHADREMVGYAFKVNEKNIKLLSLQDCGTHQRWWYDTCRNYLIGRAGHVRNLICKSFTEFVRRVNQQPYVVNEALVKLNKDDLFAIVIGKDTPKARQIAIERRLAILCDYKLDLPILFYNPEQRKATVYTSFEQRHDYPELFLIMLKHEIQSLLSICGKPNSFFISVSNFRLRIDNQNYDVTPITAKTILGIIKANTKTPGDAFAEIMKILQPTKEHERSFGLSQSD